MIRVGKALTVVAILGFVAMLSQSIPSIREYVAANSWGDDANNGLGALASLAIFGGWALALFHWGTRYVGDLSKKRSWGFALIFGMFIGSWAYWLSRPSTSVE